MIKKNLYFFILLIVLFYGHSVSAAVLIDCSDYSNIDKMDCIDLNTPQDDYCVLCKESPSANFICRCSNTQICTLSASPSVSCNVVCDNNCQIPDSPECDSAHLNLCTSQSECSEAGGNWCDGACQAETCTNTENEEEDDDNNDNDNQQISPENENNSNSDGEIGDSCESQADCGEGLYCNDQNLCALKNAGANPCKYDYECMSGNCENGVCAIEGGKDSAESGSENLGEAISKVEGFMEKGPIKGEMISEDVPTLVGNALRVFLGIVGSLALAIFIYGGIMWMTSGGNPERIKKAQGTIVWSVLGLMVIFLSYVIVSMIISGISHESEIIEQQAEQRDACLEQCLEQREEDLARCQELDKPDTGEIDEEEYELCVKSARSKAENCRDVCRERFQ